MNANKSQNLEKIRDILYAEWNPIGGEDLPTDEYDGYVERVFALFNAPKIDIRELANQLSQWEVHDFGIHVHYSRNMWIAGLLLAVRHPFRRALAVQILHLEDVMNTPSTTDREDDHLSGMKKVMNLLWELPWELYQIDEPSSSLEVLPFRRQLADGNALQEGGSLRLRVVHRQAKLQQILNGSELDKVYVEIVMGVYDVTITYPGGHAHFLYEEVIELLPTLFEQGWKMKYWFQGDRLIASGLWDERAHRYIEVKQLTWNPLRWMNALIHQKNRSERDYTLTWRNEP